jgi:hypothetical protein
MPYLQRDSTVGETVQSRNRLPMDVEVLHSEIACGSKGRARLAGWWAVLQPVIDGFVNKPADADRGVGARDQKRAREAATCHRHNWRSLGPVGRRDPVPGAGRRRRRLGELVEPALEKLLISTEIRQFVSRSGRKTRQQRDRGD